MRVVLIFAALVMIAPSLAAQPVPTGHGSWYFWRHESELETVDYLVLYGQIEGGMTWTLARECKHGVPSLMALAENQGDAIDMDHVYYQMAIDKRGRSISGSGMGVEFPGWLYKTRYKVDSGEVKTRVWMYGFDSDGGVEQLYKVKKWMKFRTDKDDQGNLQWKWDAGHGIDDMLSGDKLVIEISPSRGIAVFYTSGFQEAFREHCPRGHRNEIIVKE